MKEVMKTARLCGVCYGLGCLIVYYFWPMLSPLTSWFPDWLPSVNSMITSAFLLFVITHMERGHLNPHGFNFLALYGLVCLSFGLSTLHPSQYNTGTAAMEMAFVLMCSWKIIQKYQNDRAEVDDKIVLSPPPPMKPRAFFDVLDSRHL